MTNGMLATRERRRRRRGAIILEFVLTVPFSILLVFLCVDVGRYVLAKAALHDSVAVAARAGARTGVVGSVPGGGDCVATPQSGQQVYRAFCQAQENTVGGADLKSLSVALVNEDGGERSLQYCEADGGYLYVRVEAEGKLSLLLPDLANLSTVRASAVARCEVAR